MRRYLIAAVASALAVLAAFSVVRLAIDRDAATTRRFGFGEAAPRNQTSPELIITCDTDQACPASEPICRRPVVRCGELAAVGTCVEAVAVTAVGYAACGCDGNAYIIGGDSAGRYHPYLFGRSPPWPPYAPNGKTWAEPDDAHRAACASVPYHELGKFGGPYLVRPWEAPPDR